MLVRRSRLEDGVWKLAGFYFVAPVRFAIRVPLGQSRGDVSRQLSTDFPQPRLNDADDGGLCAASASLTTATAVAPRCSLVIHFRATKRATRSGLHDQSAFARAS